MSNSGLANLLRTAGYDPECIGVTLVQIAAAMLRQDGSEGEAAKFLEDWQTSHFGSDCPEYEEDRLRYWTSIQWPDGLAAEWLKAVEEADGLRPAAARALAEFNVLVADELSDALGAMILAVHAEACRRAAEGDWSPEFLLLNRLSATATVH